MTTAAPERRAKRCYRRRANRGATDSHACASLNNRRARIRNEVRNRGTKTILSTTTTTDCTEVGMKPRELLCRDERAVVRAIDSHAPCASLNNRQGRFHDTKSARANCGTSRRSTGSPTSEEDHTRGSIKRSCREQEQQIGAPGGIYPGKWTISTTTKSPSKEEVEEKAAALKKKPTNQLRGLTIPLIGTKDALQRRDTNPEAESQVDRNRVAKNKGINPTVPSGTMAIRSKKGNTRPLTIWSHLSFSVGVNQITRQKTRALKIRATPQPDHTRLRRSQEWQAIKRHHRPSIIVMTTTPGVRQQRNGQKELVDGTGKQCNNPILKSRQSQKTEYDTERYGNWTGTAGKTSL